jgi:zinc protease
MKKLVFAFLALSVVGNAQTDYPIFEDPLNVKEYVLKNGLTVMLSENRNTPQIFGAIAVKAGGKNDPKEATGMAHYLEHMLFKGTKEMGTWDYEKEAVHLKEIERLYEVLGKTTDEKERANIQQKINEAAIKAGEYAIPNEMDRMLSEMGGTKVNAFTTTDFTAYFNEFPANKLEQWLQIYDHRFEEPVFRLFQSELETVYEEKNISMDSPFNYVFEQFSKNFWKNHPYGQQPIIGITEHLKNPSLEKMYQYFNTYYVANNMVLTLSGDFDTEEAMRLIEYYFSDWRQGEIPVFPKYDEVDFSGKEAISIKATPVKAALRGYRSPAVGHPDQMKMQLANSLLSNSEGSGLIDNLANEGKLSYAGMMPMEYNDYGASIVLIIPKIMGQTFEKADELVNQQIEKLKKGDFSDEFFQGAKTSLQKDFEKQLEVNEDRALLMMSAYTANTSWPTYLNNYKQIKNFTKADIVATANKYFVENYLEMYSSMGSPKKDKLAKPKFEAVIPPDGKVSKFTSDWRQLETLEIETKFVDFNKDINNKELAKNVNLRTVANPFNEIFDLRISYGLGKQADSLLIYVPLYLNKLGTQTDDVTQFKNKLFQLGASAYFSSTENELILEIEGLDENLKATLDLIQDFLKNTKPTKEAIQAMAEEVASERKLSYKEANVLMKAAQQYAVYGYQSSFLQEMPMKEIKKLTPEILMNSFRNAQTYGMKINYIGTIDSEKIAEILVSKLELRPVEKTATEKVHYVKAGFDSPKVYFVNQKKALQSQVLFLMEGNPMNRNMAGNTEAFNLYFGGDMSSLVFQEIREFRSLAYSTAARYQMASKENVRNDFFAYVGCQGDKTPEALEVMNDLITNMPLKAEREKAIREALISEAKTSKPGFRELIKNVDAWKEMGYAEDPNIKLLSYYKDLSFQDILAFYEKEIKGRNMQLIVVGNKKKFSPKILKGYGKVIPLKVNKITQQ